MKKFSFAPLVEHEGNGGRRFEGSSIHENGLS
jgi:hypothetical protein